MVKSTMSTTKAVTHSAARTRCERSQRSRSFVHSGMARPLACSTAKNRALAAPIFSWTSQYLLTGSVTDPEQDMHGNERQHDGDAQRLADAGEVEAGIIDRLHREIGVAVEPQLARIFKDVGERHCQHDGDDQHRDDLKTMEHRRPRFAAVHCNARGAFRLWN